MSKVSPSEEKNRHRIECRGAAIQYKNGNGDLVTMNDLGDILGTAGESATGLACVLDHLLRTSSPLLELDVEWQEFLLHVSTSLKNIREKLRLVYPDSDDYRVDLSPKGGAE